MAQLFAVMYGKLAISLPLMACFGTFDTDLSEDTDLSWEMFLEDLHLESTLSIEILRYLLGAISSLSESIIVTDCLLSGFGMTLKRLWSWLRTC